MAFQSFDTNALANALSQFTNMTNLNVVLTSINKLIIALDNHTAALTALNSKLPNLSLLVPPSTTCGSNTRQQVPPVNTAAGSTLHNANKSTCAPFLHNVAPVSSSNALPPTHSRVLLPTPNNNFPHNSFMTKLIELKNKRNDAFYKAQRNKMLIDLYLSALTEFPQRIPKKFAPTFHRVDSDEIRQGKIRIAVEKTNNCIAEMNIHMNIHNTRLASLEKQVVSFISSEAPTHKHDKLLNDYKIIVKKNDENALKKINTKYIFSKTNSHMYTLKESHIPVNHQLLVTDTSKQQSAPIEHANSPAPNIILPPHSHNDTDIDDIDPSICDSPFSPITHTNLKRKASLNSLDSNTDTGTKYFLPFSTSTQPSKIPISSSKNLRYTKQTVVAKAASQV